MPKRPSVTSFAFVMCAAALSAATAAEGAELVLKVVEKKAPEAVAEPLRGALQEKALQLLDGGKPVYEFWLAKAFPLKKRPGSEKTALREIPEAAFLGVVVVHKGQRDYRDDELYENVFTMRFALQPEDGDHLDTADFPYFALLIPASMDKKLQAFTTHDAVSDASSEDTATEHPVIISLRPASAKAEKEPKIVEPAPDHKSILLQVPAKIAGSEEMGTLSFEIVFEGAGEA